jgi:hypothetical protein
MTSQSLVIIFANFFKGDSVFRKPINCDILANGYVRVQTAFKYPGNEYVDIVINPSDISVISDGGNTLADWTKEEENSKQEHIVQICEELNITRTGGMLTVTGIDQSLFIEQIGSAVMRLGQACIRIGQER